MKRVALYSLLGVSLLFNAFFLVGYLEGRATAQQTVTEEGRGQALASRLRLTPEQRRQLDELRQQARALNAARKEHQREVWQEMAQAHPDRARLRTAMLQNLRQQNELRARLIDRLTEFSRSLTPEQHAEFLRLARARMPEIARQLPATQEGK